MKVRFAFVVLTLAFLVLCVGLIPIFDERASFPLGLLVGAGVAVLIVLPREWARDRHATAIFMLAMLSLPVFAAGATMALFDGAVRLKALALTLVLLVPSAWLVRVVWQERHLQDLLPYWLLTRFPRHLIFEDEGVAWALSSDGTDIARGCRLLVHLQNNVEAERSVRIRLRDESGFLLSSGRVAFPELGPVTLPARAHAVVTVPLAPNTERVLDRIRVYASLDARGPAAPRNRGWRAQPGPRPLPRWVIVLGPLTGHFVLRRGGVFVTVHSSGTPALPAPVAPASIEFA